MTDIDLFGPGAAGAPRALATTADVTTADGADTFFGDCVANTPGTGTPYMAKWANRLMQQMRRVVRLSGVPLGAAAAPADDLLGQAIQSGATNWIGTFGGTGAALTATLSPVPSTLLAGTLVRGFLPADLIGGATLNVGFGVAAIKRPDGGPLNNRDGRAATVAQFLFDGAVFRIMSPIVGMQASIFDQSVSTSAGGTLTAAQCGATIQLSPTTSGSPVVLPLSSTCANGARLEFFHNGIAGQALNVQGSDVIAMANGVALTSITLNTGDTLVLESTGVSGEWLAVGGSAQIGYSAAFGKSLSSAGYQRLPGGGLRQWGTVSLAAGTNSVVITLPIAFPNAAFAYGANDNGASNFCYGAVCNTTQITVSVQPYYVTPGGSVSARAIGAGGSWWAVGN